MSSFEELLVRDGKLIYKTKGVSMRPLLHQNRDLVIIEVPKGRLKVNDVAFYKRGMDYVLHRVIKVNKDSYVIRGDNTYRIEIVPDSAILGVLTSFVHKGKLVSIKNPLYQCYVRIWNYLYPLRYFLVRCRRIPGYAKRRVLKKRDTTK